MKLRLLISVFAAASLAGCAGLLGGGSKVPPTLQTLTPEAADPGTVTRTAAAGQAVTIATPIVPSQLRTLRVPVQVSPTDVQYVTNLRWVDTPDKLFQGLVEETVRRTTNRVVVNPGQTGLDPGIVVQGELERFGYDARSGQVMVAYNASMSSPDGAQVQTKRFVANEAADGTGPSVGAALNRAANEVAQQVAQWIGG